MKIMGTHKESSKDRNNEGSDVALNPFCYGEDAQSDDGDDDSENNRYRNKENLGDLFNTKRKKDHSSSQKKHLEFTLSNYFKEDNREIMNNNSFFGGQFNLNQSQVHHRRGSPANKKFKEDSS